MGWNMTGEPKQFLTPSADYTVRDQQRMSAATRYFRWQYELVRPHLGRRVLEVGCGLGNFTRLLADRELVVGIDVEPTCVQNLLNRLPHQQNLVVRHLDVSDPDFRSLKTYCPDSIVCLNVLEHIEDDRFALANLHAVLPSGGSVILIVPAFEALYGPVDANLGHYRRYSKRGLHRLLESLGFRLECARFMNFLGFFGWWFNARVLKKTEQSEGQIRIFDSLVVPAQSRIEGLLEPPCGQSIFVVARKNV
jgi:SAM-dependent methyltransferase